MANLYDPPGTPLGTAHHAERDKIRAHLRRRVWRFFMGAGDGLHSPHARLERRVDAIQMRLHKYDPPLRVRQEAARRAAPPPSGAVFGFTWDELDRLLEHFDGANDDIGQSIANKVRVNLARRQ